MMKSIIQKVKEFIIWIDKPLYKSIIICIVLLFLLNLRFDEKKEDRLAFFEQDS
jgi:hypothetical protein